MDKEMTEMIRRGIVDTTVVNASSQKMPLKNIILVAVSAVVVVGAVVGTLFVFYKKNNNTYIALSGGQQMQQPVQQMQQPVQHRAVLQPVQPPSIEPQVVQHQKQEQHHQQQQQQSRDPNFMTLQQLEQNLYGG